MRSPRLRLSVTPAAIALGCCWLCLEPGGLFWPFWLGVACHEAGHLAALRLLGVPVTALRVTALGCILETGAMSYRAEACCAAAGPAASLLVCLLLPRLLPRAALMSLLLAAGNLLPLWPLDGGRILLAVASQQLPLAQAQQLSRICAALTLALCWALAIFAACRLHLGLWPPLLAASLQLRAGRALQSEKFLAKKPGCRYNKSKHTRNHAAAPRGGKRSSHDRSTGPHLAGRAETRPVCRRRI